MTIEQANYAFFACCGVVLVVLFLCFLFNDKIKISNFYGYFFSWAALGLLILAALFYLPAIDSNSNNRKSDCRSELVLEILNSSVDYSTDEIDSILRDACL